MTIKHRGVKIVPVKVTRFEVRTVDGKKLKSFTSTATARAWIDGYVLAVEQLTPKAKAPPVETPTPPKRRRRVNGDGQPAAQAG